MNLELIVQQNSQAIEKLVNDAKDLSQLPKFANTLSSSDLLLFRIDSLGQTVAMEYSVFLQHIKNIKIDTTFPELVVTKTIVAVENTLGAFITNQANYTFSEGTAIVIISVPDVAGDTFAEYYLYNGGDKSLAASYDEFTAARVEWNNIVGKPTNLETVEGSQAKANQAVVDAKAYSDSLNHGGSSPLPPYSTMAALYADQANQTANASYKVTDASAFATVDSGSAWFEYLGTTNAGAQDYEKRSEAESMDLDLSSYANTRLSNLVADLSVEEKSAIKTKLGVTDGGGSAAGIKVYNVETYGAVHDGITDDTSAIQTAIQACFDGGGGTVYFPNGVYFIDGAIDPNSNAQIYFPLDSINSTATLKTIKLLGETAPNQYSNPFTAAGQNSPSEKGVILKSNLLSASNVISTRHEAVSWGSFSFLHAQMENITVRVRSKTATTNVAAQATGVDMRKIAYFNAVNLEVSSTSNYDVTVEPLSSAWGVRFPANNNFVFPTSENVLVTGLHTGFDLYEHSSINNCFVDLCVDGVNFNSGNHSIHVGKIVIARCRNNFKAQANSYFYVEHVSIENDPLKVVPTPVWNKTLYDLYDVAGSASGLIRTHIVRSNFGVDYGNLLRNRANDKIKFIKINDISGEFAPKRPTVENGGLAFWRFDELTGSYKDSSGNGRTATRVNGATSGAGKVGNAMLLSAATNQHANAGSVGLSQTPTGIAFAGWVKINTHANAFQVLFNKGNATTREYNCYYTKGGTNILTFTIFNGTTSKGSVQLANMPLDAWFWLYAESNGATVKLQINNTLSASATATGLPSVDTVHPLTIGTTDTTGSSVDGGFDELMIFNRPLTEAEKTAYINEGRGNSV